jgi:cation transport protein ChaC
MTRQPPYDCRTVEAERLSGEALEESLEKMLAEHARADIWIFGYGSLMWNPEFDYDVHHVATIFGYHREFCLWSRINRGTPEQPGLVLTLERGGSCRGIAFRLRPATARMQLSNLWRREMSMGSYIPRWLECRSGADRFEALGFVVNRRCTGYTGKLPLETMVTAIATARGKYGSSAEYLFRTEATLEQHGIRDDRVRKLAERVRLHIANDPARQGTATGRYVALTQKQPPTPAE